MGVSAGADSLPVNDDVLPDFFFPRLEPFLVAGDPGGGVAHDEHASGPDAARFSGEWFRNDGT